MLFKAVFWSLTILFYFQVILKQFPDKVGLNLHRPQGRKKTQRGLCVEEEEGKRKKNENRTYGEIHTTLASGIGKKKTLVCTENR